MGQIAGDTTKLCQDGYYEYRVFYDGIPISDVTEDYILAQNALIAALKKFRKPMYQFPENQLRKFHLEQRFVMKWEPIDFIPEESE